MLSGDKPSAILVAESNKTTVKSPISFGNIYAFDDPLTVGPEPTSQVIGNAQGTYLLSGQDKLSLVMSADFAFVTGEFDGSSFGVMSQNPISETSREIAIVGGRGKFRFARGYAELKTQYLNFTNGDAIIEYHATVYHY
ncbi:hypothetical protein MKW92_038459 [Papaver armeniacum]|nr:hypothetical protein MKW92_038459 [Papaver armeniacum]